MTCCFRPSAGGLQLTADQATLVFEYEDSSGLRARKSFTFQASLDQPYVVGFSASVTTAAGTLPVRIRWGPAIGGGRLGVSRMTFPQPPAAVLYGRAFENGLLQEVDIYRAQPADLLERSTYEGELEFVGVDNKYFLAAAVPGDPDLAVRGRRRDGRLQPGLGRWFGARSGGVRSDGRTGRGRPAGLYRAERLRRAARRAPGPGAGDRLRVPVCHRRAAAPDAEMDLRVRRQLWLVDHSAHRADQRPDLPAAPQERGVDAEDAGAAAGDEGDPGALQRSQGDRPGEAEDEPGGDGAVSEARCQPRERVFADAGHDADPVRVLPVAVDGDRDSGRAVHVVDHRPVGE